MTQMKRSCCCLAVLLTLGVVFGTRVVAQTSTAQISGTITDASGAVVPQAKVTVTNEETGVKRELQTNDVGSYMVPMLPPGRYTVGAEKQGLARVERKGLVMNVGDLSRIDLALPVGGTQQTVTVEGSAETLNTENSEISQVISENQVVDLPLNGRQWEQLIFLGAGSFLEVGSPQVRANSIGNLGINGARTDANEYLIDGMTNRDVAFGAPIINPSIDALAEFKEETTTYSAEYGGASNQINLHYKSGTNELHGTAFEFLRNEALDDRGYFDGPTKAILRQNQFGYSLGGPIIIPKLYNGKNKTFFFANYEGLRNSSSGYGYLWLIPTAERQGQFSTPINDPLTGAPFPSNTIPTARISQFAQAYFPFMLQPNLTGSALGNYFGSGTSGRTSDQQNYKFDENIGTKDSMFFRYTTAPYPVNNGGFDPLGTTDNITQEANSNGWQVSETHTFSPTIVNLATFGYAAGYYDMSAHNITRAQFNSFGINGSFADATPETPDITLTDTFYSGFGVNPNFPQIDEQQNHDFSDGVSITRGAHTFKLGASYRWWAYRNGKGANDGLWTFDNTNTGDTIANFLLGQVRNVSEWPQPTPLVSSASQISFTFREYSIMPYFEDEWKVNKRLTLNIGLRYDFTSMPREAQGRYVWQDYTSPGGGLCTADKYAMGLGYSNSLEHYCGTDTPGPAPKIVFAPRLGIAYQLNPKTVVRTGYGIFFEPNSIDDTVNAAGVYPFSQISQYSAVGTNLLSTAAVYPTITTTAPPTPAQLGFLIVFPRWQPAYTQQWSLTIDRELGSGTKLELTYNGSKGTHLNSRVFLNEPTTPYDPANPTSYQSRVPYPNFDSFWGFSDGLNSSYNAGTIKIERHVSDMVLLASYTWDKSMDDRSGRYGDLGDTVDWGAPLDSRDIRRDWAQSGFDYGQRFVASFVYNLPFGKGKRFFSNMPTIANYIAGGWQLNGIYTLQGGQPLSVTADDLQSQLDAGSGQRANVTGSPYPAGFKQSMGEWFNTAAFSQPAIGVFGNSGRDILKRPGIDNLDASLFKNIPIWERAKLQLRVEGFNALNHTQWGIPSTYVNAGPTFGTIGSIGVSARILQVAAKVIW